MTGQFSRTKNAGKMVGKRALDLGHIPGHEVNMAERLWRLRMLRPKTVNLLVKKMSKAQRKVLRKELEKHPCLSKTCGPEDKNKPRRSRALDELCQKFNISPNCLKKQLHTKGLERH